MSEDKIKKANPQNVRLKSYSDVLILAEFSVNARGWIITDISPRLHCAHRGFFRSGIGQYYHEYSRDSLILQD